MFDRLAYSIKGSLDFGKWESAFLLMKFVASRFLLSSILLDVIR